MGRSSVHESLGVAVGTAVEAAKKYIAGRRLLSRSGPFFRRLGARGATAIIGERVCVCAVRGAGAPGVSGSTAGPTTGPTAGPTADSL
jgi:hypothetical protein